MKILKVLLVVEEVSFSATRGLWVVDLYVPFLPVAKRYFNFVLLSRRGI